MSPVTCANEKERLDFGGDFISVALHGFTHGDFATTPWLCGAPEDFGKHTERSAADQARIGLLLGLLTDFFDTYLRKSRFRMALLTATPEQQIRMDVFSQSRISRRE
jgi:hypothetical protein